MGLTPYSRATEEAQRQVYRAAYEIWEATDGGPVIDRMAWLLVPGDWGNAPDDFLTVTDQPEARLPVDLPYNARVLRSAVEWQSLIEAHEGQCLYCGDAEQPLTIDHIRPRKLGGTHDRGNLAPACQSCNSSKGARPLLVWLGRRPDLKLAVIRARWEWAQRGTFPE